MSQTNFTPISIYYSTTASAVPTAANLVPGELAINTADGKLYYEDSSGVVQVLATKSTGSIGGSNTQVQFNNSGSLGGSSSFTWDGTTVTATKFAGALNGTVGATTASTGAFTTLSTSSTTTFSGLTASTALALDASKNVVSVTNTGTGNNVLSASPTLTGTIAGASLSLSSLTSGRVTYAGASGLLTDSSTFVFNGTQLGVGTASPGAAIESFVTSTSTPSLRLRYNSSSYYADHLMDGNGNYVIKSPTANGVTSGNILLNAAGTLFLYTNATEAMRITSAGLVGIGTSSPSALLEVSGALGSSSYSEAARFTNTSVNSGTKLTFYGVQGVQTPALLSGSIGFNQTFNQNNNGQPAFIIEVGNSGSISEKVRVTYDGNLLVGTTASLAKFVVDGTAYISSITGIASTRTSGKLNIDANINSENGIDIQSLQSPANGSFIIFRNSSGAAAGSITHISSTAVLYNTTSDQRVKTNIIDAPSGNIDDIKVRSFDWIADGGHQEYGMIAQELVTVAPYAVHQPTNPDEMMGVDYSKLVPMMIKEIQDLKAEVNQLKAKIGV